MECTTVEDTTVKLSKKGTSEELPDNKLSINCKNCSSEFDFNYFYLNELISLNLLCLFYYDFNVQLLVT